MSSIMYRSGEKMVLVEFGVNRARHLRMVLSVDTILIIPVPMAVKSETASPLLAYVVMGMGFLSSLKCHRRLRLLVALQLAPVSPCMALSSMCSILICLRVRALSSTMSYGWVSCGL